MIKNFIFQVSVRASACNENVCRGRTGLFGERRERLCAAITLVPLIARCPGNVDRSQIIRRFASSWSAS